MSTIVLAHGFFGFGDILPGILNRLQPFHYFNEVARHFRNDLHLNVFEPGTNPIGSIEQRAKQLAAAIRKNNLSDPLHIIGHSMGGLDARFLITHLPEVGQRVATLVTVGTPHAGSPVADAFMVPGGPLARHIPPLLLELLHKNAGAIADLTIKSCEKFNSNTPDVKGVKYLEIAGSAPQNGSELLLTDLAAKIGEMDGDNDGMVTVVSARRPGRKLFAIWPVDHPGEIGWNTVTLNPLNLRRGQSIKEHLERYDQIISAILPKANGAGN
jgi:triacylglycerol lipase